MSLILAIEPDRRQVAHLISIVRHVKGAELILADTTERALESIGNNVPDLILVPALLSPQDDAALAAALRVIATAAHVQMLTIPTFAVPKPKRKGGVLSAFRRKPAEDEALEGCDPKVFAEEIASYIERANEERAAAQLYEDEQGELQPEPVPASLSEFDETPAADEPVEPVSDEPAYNEPLYADSAEPAYEKAAEFAANEVLPRLEDLVVAPDTIETYIAPDTAPAIYRPVERVVPFVAEAAPPFAEAAPEEAPEVLGEADAPAPTTMAADEFASTLEHQDAVTAEEAEVEVAEDLPLAAVPELEPEEEVELEAPAFEDLLANFESANLPVIEEVSAEQWMGDTDEPLAEDSDAFEAEADDLDIDLSIELNAVLHAEEPGRVPEPKAALKPFEPVVPVERFDPMPLAAWNAWPRLDWTAPEKPADKLAASPAVTEGHIAAKPDRAPDAQSPTAFVQVEFEDALDAEETARLEHFEPVVPVERLDPMPLAAWHVWPRLEGVAAEAYQAPIAPRKAVAKPEWVELMRSLREDIARRREELAASGPTSPAGSTEPVPPPAPQPQRPRTVRTTRVVRAAAEPRVPAARPAATPAVPDEPKPRPKRTRPIEDEWGLFDPEQCGFAALLDKLDEITVTPPTPPSRRTR